MIKKLIVVVGVLCALEVSLCSGGEKEKKENQAQASVEDLQQRIKELEDTYETLSDHEKKEMDSEIEKNIATLLEELQKWRSRY